MKLRMVAGLLLTGTLLLSGCSSAPSATDAVVQDEETGTSTLRVMAHYGMDKGLVETIPKFEPRPPKPVPERERRGPLNEPVDQVMQGKKSVPDAVAEWAKSKP